MSDTLPNELRYQIARMETELSLQPPETVERVLACEEALAAPSVRLAKEQALDHGRRLSELADELDPALFARWAQLRGRLAPPQVSIYLAIHERFGHRREDVLADGLHCIDLAGLALESEETFEGALEYFAWHRAALRGA